MWKIRKINKGTAHHVTQKPAGNRQPKTRLEHVIRIIIESGMLYTLFVILTFICELAGSNAIYGVSDMVRSVSPSFARSAHDLPSRRWSSSSASPSTSSSSA